MIIDKLGKIFEDRRKEDRNVNKERRTENQKTAKKAEKKSKK